ncbi:MULTISPECIES: helix-turn-helix domain-containing protein [unclassified Paenibacillus]|uniref:helix-turn-helix domain-containing protein n=1 Tax=unclassified Paenibacillus TaxID=185978 RepID=UPI003642EF20
MRIIKRRIPQKVLTVYVAVFVSIVILTASLSYWSVAVHVKEDLDATRIDLLKQLGQKVDLVLRGIDKTTLNLVQEMEVVRFMEGNLPEDQQKYEVFNNLSNTLRTILDANNILSSIYLYSSGNNLIASSSTLEKRSQFFDSEWVDMFHKINDISVWIGPRKVTYNANTSYSINKNVITLMRSYPLTATGLRKKGSVAANINEEKLNELISDTNSRLGQVFVMDGMGNVISHQNKERLYQNTGKIWFGDDFDQLQQSGQQKIQIDGMNGQVYYYTSPYTGWIFMNFMPDEKQDEQLGVIRNILLTVALGMVVFAVIAALMLSNRFYRPMQQALRSISTQLKGEADSSPAEMYGNLDYLEKKFSQVITDNRTMNQQLRDSKPVMKWSLLMDLLLGNRTSFAAEKPLFDFLGIRLYSSNYIVMVAEFDKPEELGSERDAQLYTFGLCNMAEEYMNATGKGASIQLELGKAAFIMSFEDENASGNIVTALSIGELIHSSVEQYFNKSVSIGLSRHTENMRGLKLAYLESLEALKYKLVLGMNMVLSIEDLKIPSSESTIKIFATREGVADALREGNVKKTEQLFDELINKAVQENFPPETMKQLCVQVLVESLSEALELNVDVSEITRKHGDLYQTINNSQELAEIRAYSKNILIELIRLIQEKRSSRSKNEAFPKILDYIHDNYQRADLSLNLIAEKFDFSVSYLSRLFKEQMECNFLEYLIGIRVRAAQEMLISTGMKINEIAEEVGYSNSYSFNRIFKKYTGMTPGEYKERNS